MATYEEKAKEIDSLLDSAQSQWTLNQIAHVDYDDARQIIRNHIYNKIHKWNPEKGKFASWAKRVIKNQIKNIQHSVYYKYNSPCVGCPYNLGDDICSLNKSGKKSNECEKYGKWEKKRGVGRNMEMASSIDEHHEDKEEEENKVQLSGGIVNISQGTARLHVIMMAELDDRLGKFYKLKYIDGVDDEVISFSFGFTTSEEGRLPGYRQIYHMDAEIKQLAEFIVYNRDIF